MESRIIYLNSNDGTGVVGFGTGHSFTLTSSGNIQEVQDFVDRHKGEFVFIALSYDLKNHFSSTSSNNQDGLNFPDAILWAPEVVVKLNGTEFSFLKGESSENHLSIAREIISDSKSDFKIKQELKARIDKEEYLTHISQLKDEIQFGNIYEINFCQEFFAENISIDNPLHLYHRINQITRTPFSSFFKFDEFNVMSGSPERFIRKTGTKLISQPIKGTIGRGTTEAEDEALIEKLKSDPKEKAENVMIVDLVRNDLSRIAKKASVQVDELFGIYTFETVHQMISTVSCDIDSSTNFVEILKALFPMGSMTGAPKISAMNLIEKHESFKRGIYSGSVGYIDPNGDFDLNVVIRSLVYNNRNKYLSCGVGGAITIQSDPESEYQECYTKVNSILKGICE